MTAPNSLGGPGAGAADAAETVACTAESLLAFENAALPLAVCDPGGQIVMCNRSLRTLLGYDLDEMVGMPVGAIVEHDPDALYTTWAARTDATAVGITPERRIHIYRKDGSAVAVRASSSLVHDDEGHVRYVIARAVVDHGL